MLFCEAGDQYQIPDKWNSLNSKSITIPKKITEFLGGLYFYAPSISFLKKLPLFNTNLGEVDINLAFHNEERIEINSNPAWWPKTDIVRILFFLLCLSYCGKLSAQTISPLWCHELNREKGLSSEEYNFYTYCDKQDFIWINSTKGLNRFDGLQVKQYRSNFQDTTAMFGENIQSSFFEDSDGQLWFCTYEAVHFYDRENDRFRHFFVRNEQGQEIKQSYFVFYLEQDRYLWFRADDQIHRVDVSEPDKLQEHFAKSKGLYTSEHFHSSVGTDDSGAVSYIFSSSNEKEKGLDLIQISNGKLVSKAAYFDDKDEQNPSSSIFQVYYESEQSVWLATNHGMINWDLKENTNNVYPFQHKKYAFFTPTKTENLIVSF